MLTQLAKFESVDEANAYLKDLEAKGMNVTVQAMNTVSYDGEIYSIVLALSLNKRGDDALWKLPHADDL